MITITQNGKEKTYYARCSECGSELDYTYDDVKYETSAAVKYAKGRFIICPVCGEPISVSLMTKKESELASQRSYGYACVC